MSVLFNMNPAQINNWTDYPYPDPGAKTESFWSDGDVILGNSNDNSKPSGRGGLQGYGGADYIDGGDGNDDIYGFADPNVRNGADTAVDGDDWLVGGDGNDRLYGQSGNDQINPGSGTNQVDGGSGRDIVNYGDLDEAISANLSLRTVQHGGVSDTINSIEDIQGSVLDDTIIGDANANLIIGYGGNDALDGGGGSDTAHFTGAREFYAVSLLSDGAIQIRDDRSQQQIENDAGAHTAAVSNGTDTLRSFELFRFRDGTVSDRETLFDGDNFLWGSDGADTLDGYAGNDRIDGGGGADTMRGGPGDDRYVVDDPGDLVVEEGPGIDRVESSVSHTLAANVEDLKLTGTSAISGVGNALDNWIIGNGAANLLKGGAGADRMWGAAGDDTLLGGPGQDDLRGGAGEDTLVGGKGADTLRGGFGPDTFVFGSSGHAQGDSIADFRRGETIDLSAIDADATRKGNQAFTFDGDRFDGSPGSLRLKEGWLAGDLDGDRRADFRIGVGDADVHASDILL